MQKGTIFGIVALFAVVSYIAYSEFPQQTAVAVGENRMFMHAPEFREALDEAQYTDDTPVASNPSFSYVDVVNWDDVKALDKAEIRAQAALNGYEEIIP